MLKSKKFFFLYKKVSNEWLSENHKEELKFYVDMKNDANFTSMMHADAMFLAYYFANHSIGPIVEIGTYEGATSVGLSKGGANVEEKVIHVTCQDLEGVSYFMWLSK